MIIIRRSSIVRLFVMFFVSLRYLSRQTSFLLENVDAKTLKHAIIVSLLLILVVILMVISSDCNNNECCFFSHARQFFEIIIFDCTIFFVIDCNFIYILKAEHDEYTNDVTLTIVQFELYSLFVYLSSSFSFSSSSCC